MAELADTTKVTLIRLVLFAICILAGAAVFQALEGPHQREEVAKYRNIRKQIALKYNISDEDVGLWAKTYQPNTPPGSEGDFLEWSFGNACLFAMIVVTTIGYGNLVPKTTWGRIFCMGFALFGIPGTCLTLKSIGDKIAQHVALLIRRIEKRCFKIQRSKNVELKASLMTVISTLILFLPLLSCIVYVREPQWTYLECFYFTFITLSTIGFGDFQPNFRTDVDYLLIIVAFLGLSLISGIFCSLNFWIENYGVSTRIVRSLREKSMPNGKRNSSNAESTGRYIQRNRAEEWPNRAEDRPNRAEDATFGDENSFEEKDTENIQLEPRRTNDCAEESVRNNGHLCDPPVPRREEKRGSSVSLQLGIFRM